MSKQKDGSKRELGPGVGGENDNQVGGLARWVGGAVLLSVVVFAALRGWYGVALVALGLGLGPYLGRALSRLFRGWRALLAVAVALGVSGVLVAGLGLLGLISFARVGGVGLWPPVATLLLAAVPRPVVERERLKDADKLGMMLAPWRKALIVVAGPAVNVLLAFALLLCGHLAHGEGARRPRGGRHSPQAATR